MMGFGFGSLGMIFMLLFWLVIVGLAVWFVSTLFPRSTERSFYQPGIQSRGPVPSPALATVEQRYAQGQITRAEYERMRHDLQD